MYDADGNMRHQWPQTYHRGDAAGALLVATKHLQEPLGTKVDVLDLTTPERRPLFEGGLIANLVFDGRRERILIVEEESRVWAGAL